MRGPAYVLSRLPGGSSSGTGLPSQITAAATDGGTTPFTSRSLLFSSNTTYVEDGLSPWAGNWGLTIIDGQNAGGTHSDEVMCIGFNASTTGGGQANLNSPSVNFMIESSWHQGAGQDQIEMYLQTYTYNGGSAGTQIRPWFFSVAENETVAAAKGYVTAGIISAGGVRGAGSLFINGYAADGSTVQLFKLTQNKFQMFYDSGSGSSVEAFHIEAQATTSGYIQFNNGGPTIGWDALVGGAAGAALSFGGGSDRGNSFIAVDATLGTFPDGYSAVTIRGRASGTNSQTLKLLDSGGTAQWSWDRTGLVTVSTTQSGSGGASAGTITNATSAGNPAKWLKVAVSGTTYNIPMWA